MLWEENSTSDLILHTQALTGNEEKSGVTHPDMLRTT